MTTAEASTAAAAAYDALVATLARGEDCALDRMLVVLAAAGRTAEQLTADVDARVGEESCLSKTPSGVDGTTAIEGSGSGG